MTLKHLLVHVDSAARAEERLDLAVAMARRAGARLTGLFAELEALGPSLVGRRSREDVSRAAAQARATFEARARAGGLATDWWQVEQGDRAEVVGAAAICCRYVDLAVLGQHDAANSRSPEDLVEEVLFGCGRPVLVVPSVGHYPVVGKRVAVAWNGSQESARAVNDALPLLQDAESITVLAFQKPSTGAGPGPIPPVDIVAHLAAHGLAARYERILVGVGEVDFADTVLNRSFDLQADLVVMGAHAEHRFGSTRAGENTRRILGSMTAPVLLSH